MASPYVFSYTFQDANGVKASVNYYYLPTDAGTVTVAQIGADAHDLGDALDAASNAKLIDYHIQIPINRDPAWKAAPVDENDVSDVISITYDNAITRYGWAGLIPNLKNSEIDGGRVNLSDADVAGVTGFVQGGAANGVFVNNAGQELTTIRNAFQADRKHRRQLRARSLVEGAG